MQSWRRPATKTVILGAVVLFHVLLLIPLLTWRSLAVVPIMPATQISLISGGGLVAWETSTPSPKAVVIDRQPAPIPNAAPPSPPAEQQSKPSSNSALMSPQNEPPKSLDRLVGELALGGANLETQPVPVKVERAQASAVSLPSRGGKTCQILEGLQAVLQQDDGVRVAIARIPRRAKSVANAILLWDRRWIDSSEVGGSSAFGSLESAVATVVGKASPDCQSELVHGPRMLAIGDARDTTILVIGSGEWRWGDVIATLSPNISP